MIRDLLKIIEAKTDYVVLHNQYSQAIEASKDFAVKNGYEIDPEEYAEKVGLGPTRPKDGETNRFSMTLTKDGKVQKKMLQIQIAGVRNKFELNMYIL